MIFKELLQQVSNSIHLSSIEAAFMLESIMQGEISSEEVASFLIAMKMNPPKAVSRRSLAARLPSPRSAAACAKTADKLEVSNTNVLIAPR